MLLALRYVNFTVIYLFSFLLRKPGHILWDKVSGIVENLF